MVNAGQIFQCRTQNKSSCVCIFITLYKLPSSSCSLHVYRLITIELSRMTCTIFIPPFSASNLDSSEQCTAFALVVSFTFENSFFIYQLRRGEKVHHWLWIALYVAVSERQFPLWMSMQLPRISTFHRPDMYLSSSSKSDSVYPFYRVKDQIVYSYKTTREILHELPP